MLKENKRPFTSIFRFFDICIIIVSYYLSYTLRFGLSGKIIFDFTLEFTIFFTSYIIIWLFLSQKFNLYISKRHVNFGDEIFDVAKCTGLTLVFASIPAFFIREFPLSRLFLLYFLPIQIILLIVFRFMLRKILKYIRQRGFNFRQVLIIGRNDRASRIAQKIADTPEFGLRILGIVDDDQNGCKYENINNLNLIGNIDDFESIMKSKIVDEVFITLPMKSYYSSIEKIVAYCEEVGVEVEIPADIFDVKFAKTNIQNYEEIKVINFYSSPEMNWKLITKRFIDLIFSLAVVLLGAPFSIIIGVLIKITSKGPIFFEQERVGYNGRLFTLLKFRTMIKQSEDLKQLLLEQNEMDGPVFKIKNDPRVTKIGRFLRRTSIDEFPQFINVIKGEMSIVGPRPPIPDEVIRYRLSDRRRLSMKPGLTCLWQVNGRNQISFEKWMELDKQYIDNWSPWLDFKILIKTIPAVLRGTGI